MTTTGAPRYRRADHHVFSTLVGTDERVLDVGCGDGALMELLRTERHADVCGLEISQTKVSKCLVRGLAVVQGDAEKDLPVYPDNAFDCAILSRAIQTMQHPHHILQELRRITPRLLVSIHNIGHWRARLSLLLSGRMPTMNGWLCETGRYPCSLLDFIDLARKTGYDIADIVPINGNRGHISRLNLVAEEIVLVLVRSAQQPA